MFKYCIDTSSVDMMLITGKRATGINEVTAKGSNSIIQEKAINKATKAHFSTFPSPSATIRRGDKASGRIMMKIDFQNWAILLNTESLSMIV